MVRRPEGGYKGLNTDWVGVKVAIEHSLSADADAGAGARLLLHEARLHNDAVDDNALKPGGYFLVNIMRCSGKLRRQMRMSTFLHIFLAGSAQSLAGKKVLVVGTGGAGQAVAYYAVQAGAQVGCTAAQTPSIMRKAQLERGSCQVHSGVRGFVTC